MSKYDSINGFSKILGVSAQTLRNWDNNGKLHPHHTSNNGYRYYSQEQLNQVMNIKPNLDRKENYKDSGEFISDKELRKEFTQLKKMEEYDWLNKVSNNVTRQVVKDACNAYKQFFKGLANFPKLKSRKHTTLSFYAHNMQLKLPASARE